MEGACINIKLIIGNRESGTGNWFLVPYLRKRLGYFKTVKSETGNREPRKGIKIKINIKRYLSAYNEYYGVSVEEAYINMKLRIGNRESGTGNRELVPCSLFE